MRWPRPSGWRWKARSAAWPSMMRPTRVSSACTPRSARPRRLPRALPPLPKSAREDGARKRKSAAAADAAHAAVDLRIVLPQPLHRLDVLAGGGRLRLALGGELGLLLLVAGF